MKVHAVNQSSMNASRGFGDRKNNNFVSSMKRNTGCYHSKVINKAETSAPQCLSAVWISGNYDSLPEVPMCYPIERTSIVVGSYDPSEIARRILRCLQMLSITAKCNASEASLFAETLDYTKFFIRMYKNDSISDEGILVELQRVDGDSFNFVQLARVILACAKGDAIDESKAARRRSSLNYIPGSLSYNLEKAGQREDTNSKYMMHVEDLIRKDRSDAVQLGIESLLLLTDRERSQVSLSAADVVLTGNEHPIIKDFVFKCIYRPQMTLSPEESAFDYDSRHCKTIHNAALAILGNSLESAINADSPDLLGSLYKSEEWVGHSGIVNLLLCELSHAEDRSHDAYHAARCLNALLDTSVEMKQTLVERGLPSAMKASQTVGRRRHSLLAQECGAALDLMVNL